MNRRQLLAALAAGAVLTAEGLWVPGKKSIFLPASRFYIPTQYCIYVSEKLFPPDPFSHLRIGEQIWPVVELHREEIECASVLAGAYVTSRGSFRVAPYTRMVPEKVAVYYTPDSIKPWTIEKIGISMNRREMRS